jgi:hypothetical protein
LTKKYEAAYIWEKKASVYLFRWLQGRKKSGDGARQVHCWPNCLSGDGASLINAFNGG